MEEDLPARLPDESVEAASSTLGGAVAISDELPRRVGDELLEAAQAAFTVGLQVSALVSAVIAAGTAVLAATLLRGLKLGSETERAGGHSAVETAPAAPPD